MDAVPLQKQAAVMSSLTLWQVLEGFFQATLMYLSLDCYAILHLVLAKRHCQLLHVQYFGNSCKQVPGHWRNGGF